MTERLLSRETMLALASDALSHGCRWQPNLAYRPGSADKAVRNILEWDVSGRCQSPAPRELFSRWSTRSKPGMSQTAVPILVRLFTRCRRCMWCRLERRNEWSDRAASEWSDASRTWLVTLTGAPEFHTRSLAQARLYQSRALINNDFDGLRDTSRFAALVRVEGQELTRYLKRLREDLRYQKGFRVPLRYLLVSEPHKSGWPHFHLLLHERGVQITKAVIQKHWDVGFSNCKLVDTREMAKYVCKYLAKDARTRVRASFRYGSVHTYTCEANSLTKRDGKIDPHRSVRLSSAEGRRKEVSRAGTSS